MTEHQHDDQPEDQADELQQPHADAEHQPDEISDPLTDPLPPEDEDEGGDQADVVVHTPWPRPGGTAVDSGGRPITDAGGRIVTLESQDDDQDGPVAEL